MKIKKIIAPSMKQALIEIKRELGEDAIILKSRKVNRGGLFSFISKELIEVTAAIDTDVPTVKRTAPAVSGLADEVKQESQLRDKYLLYDIRDDVEQIGSTLNEIGNQLKYDMIPGLPMELRRLYMTLVDNDVDKEITGKIIGDVFAELSGEQLENYVTVGKAVQNRIRDLFQVTGPCAMKDGKPLVMALIGPTGVGKTTTIAKIAAQNKFFGDKKIGLISADTYRMAAVEQLRTFARISSLPLEVVYGPDDMKPAIEKHRDKNLIIIDTAGRSHKDKEKMRELAAFIEAASPDQVHLTLSITTKIHDLMDIVDNFRLVPSDSYVFTKLDETSNFGNILNLIRHRPKPISYMTMGQNVPDDIALAERAGLARLMVCSDLEEAVIDKGINVGSSAKTQRTRLI